MNDSKAFIEYWNDMDDIYKNTEEYNPILSSISIPISVISISATISSNRFDDMIADVLNNKNLIQ